MPGRKQNALRLVIGSMKNVILTLALVACAGSTGQAQGKYASSSWYQLKSPCEQGVTKVAIGGNDNVDSVVVLCNDLTTMYITMVDPR